MTGLIVRALDQSQRKRRPTRNSTSTLVGEEAGMRGGDGRSTGSSGRRLGNSSCDGRPTTSWRT